MMRKIKTLSAVLLLLCLFLPLSQCKQEKPDLLAPTGEAKVEIKQYYVLDKGLNSVDSVVTFKKVLPAIIFSLPFILVLLSLLRIDVENRISPQSNGVATSWGEVLLEALAGLAVLAFVAVHAYLSIPLIGLYIAASAGIAYMLSLIILAFKPESV